MLASERDEQRAVCVFGYEHDPPERPLEPCIKGFELLARELMHIELTHRVERRLDGLVHPVHQVLWVFGWEVLGTNGKAAVVPDVGKGGRI